MSGRAMGSHHHPNHGATDVWLSPLDICEALGPFDLDPCAAIVNGTPWPTAQRFIAEPEDGLAAEWTGRVWLNPPYRTVGSWLARLVTYNQGTALIFARTETRIWHRHVWPHARGILFLEGRLHFHRPDGTRAKANAGAPSALIAYGQVDAQRLASYRRGKFIWLNRGIRRGRPLPCHLEDDAA